MSRPTQLSLSDILVGFVNNEASLSAKLDGNGNMTIWLLSIDGLTTCHPEASAEGSQGDSSQAQNDNCIGTSIETLAGPLSLQLNALSNLEIMAGQVIIDTKGNLTVQGTITAKNVETQNLKVLGASSAGSATLPLGQTELEITADAATDSAKILLTPTTLTDKILTVTEKEIGKFVVAISASASADLKFDWFIVGN